MLRHRLLFLVCLCSTLLASGSIALEPPLPLTRLAGETLEFRVRWGVIPAARAYLEVHDQGGGKLLFRARAETLPVVRTIYPVKELIESLVTLPGPQVTRYYKKAKEGWGAKLREEEIVFDHQAGVANARKNGKPREPLKVPADVQDPLSCFFAYRAMTVGDAPVEMEITDGKKLISGTIAVLGRETVEVPAGTFKTVIIEPKIEGIGGIFKKSPGARILIWLTDDQWRRPVKFQSKVIVGHFTVELAKIN
ncbi:MAG: DUF3108 domain-containing protein [Deltaproteobacteria bacterium]|nr:DUF3108 domain-containing protein [Deltaproteobacteria bacterium]